MCVAEFALCFDLLPWLLFCGAGTNVGTEDAAVRGTIPRKGHSEKGLALCRRECKGQSRACFQVAPPHFCFCVHVSCFLCSVQGVCEGRAAEGAGWLRPLFEAVCCKAVLFRSDYCSFEALGGGLVLLFKVSTPFPLLGFVVVVVTRALSVMMRASRRL